MKSFHIVLLGLVSCLAFSNAAPKPRVKDLEEIPNLYQGDIILRAHSKNGIIDSEYKWPGGVLVYQLDTNFTVDEQLNIFAGWAEIRDKTDGQCITFRNRTDNDIDYVFVQKGAVGSGCYSEVGKYGGRQVLNLEPACIPRSVVHETLHSIGFYHEQSRSDRDDYVTIVWDKILPGTEDNFEKYNASEITHFGAPYDYGSVLHYGATGFSIDGSPTIIPKIPGVEIGQRLAMSEIDAGKVMLMYNCTIAN